MQCPRHVLALLAALSLAAPVLAAPDIEAPQALAEARTGTLRLIDIRTPAEWRQTGVAPGAGRVDFYRGPDALLQYVLQEVQGDKDAPIALICRTGNRTTKAQAYLQGQGFTRVYNVKEGMAGSGAGPGWIKRSLPLEPCSDC